MWTQVWGIIWGKNLNIKYHLVFVKYEVSFEEFKNEVSLEEFVNDNWSQLIQL